MTIPATNTPALPTKPITTPTALNLTARVVASQVTTPSGPVAARPASLKPGNTNGLSDQSFFRCVLYSETSARKTSTAAQFAGPDFTRIILTRGEDQLLPLDGMGFQYVYCPDAASLTYAMKNPEALWPDWAKMPDPDKKRTIVIDDITKGVQSVVESNTAKDNRMAYRDAQVDVDKGVQYLGGKPYNQILIALAKVRDNQITNEEQIGPDLPPSMMNYIMAEYTAVLYVEVPPNPLNPWKMLTDRDSFAYVDTDSFGKEKTYRRNIFAKHKTSLLSLGKGPNLLGIQRREPLDLKLFWDKCKALQVGK